MSLLPHVDALVQAQISAMAAALTLGTVIALFGAGLLRLCSRCSAASRYMVALVFTCSIAIIAAHPWFRGASSPGVSSAGYISIPISIARAIFFVWAIVAAAGLLRVLHGALRIRQTKRRAIAVDQSRLPEQVNAAVRQGRRFGRGVLLLASEDVRVPAAFGFFRPAVVLPAWMVEEGAVGSDDLHALVLHELSHLARWDDWANLAQKIIKALLFFHPAVWWFDRRISTEREITCDDAVLRLTGDAQGYARCLARIAEQTYIRRTLALAQAAVGHLKLTSQRVKRLLGPAAMHSAGWKAATAISATALVAVGAATINTPQIVGLKTPSVVSAAKAGGLMPQVGPLHIAETASPAHVIPAAVPLREPATRQVIRHSGPKLADAKTKLSTGRPQIVHTALRERTRDNAPSIVVIETSEQIYTGNGMVQIQSWRVVLISNTPSAATPVNFKAVI